MKLKKNYKLMENILYCLKNLKIYKGVSFFIMSPIFIVLSVGVTFLTMALPSFVINLLSIEVSVSKLLSLVTIYVAILILLNILIACLKSKTHFEAQQFRMSMNYDYNNQILSTDYINIESEKGQTKAEKALKAIYSGTLIGLEAIVTDTNIILINILGLILYSIISLNLNPIIMITLLVFSSISLYANKKNLQWTEANKDNWTTYDRKIYYLKNQSVDLKNGKDIRLYKIEKWFEDLFYELIGKRLHWHKKTYTRHFIAQSLERVSTLIRDVIVYGYLLYKVFNGMSIPVLTLYLGIVSGFSSWIKMIFDTYNRLQSNNLVVNDFRSFVEMENYTSNESKVPIPQGKHHKITFENVTFTYLDAKKPLFDNLNLTIKSNEKLALVGVNGAGKTTLIKLLCGLYHPDSGRILLDGVDIKNFSSKDYFKEFSVVFQDVFAFAFTIAQNVACCVEDEIDYSKVEYCLTNAGLMDKIKSLPKGVKSIMLKDLDEDGIVFSGGELQKLMLARALYKNAPVLILDEPTAALDPIAESEIYEKYNSFTEEKTSIFISHRLSSTRFCDRIILLKEGQIIESGTHDELLRQNGAYADMYNIQSHYYKKEVALDVI